MFLKEFDYSIELQKMSRKYNSPLTKYGLIGEQRVAYQLEKISKYVLCLYNVRIKLFDRKAQYDFIVITNDMIYVIEVKNLLGNLYINKEGEFIRKFYKDKVLHVSGMDNPFIQMDFQKELLEELFILRGVKMSIQSLLVMANDKMIIFNESNRKEIIKYDRLSSFLSYKTRKEELDKKCFDIGKIIYEYDVKFNYNLLNVIKNNINKQYKPEFDDEIERDYFIKLLELRKKYSLENDVPICNVFSNKDAERMARAKPQTKEDFLSISGFKEKRYEMFGQEIINIFKKK